MRFTLAAVVVMLLAAVAEAFSQECQTRDNYAAPGMEPLFESPAGSAPIEFAESDVNRHLHAAMPPYIPYPSRKEQQTACAAAAVYAKAADIAVIVDARCFGNRPACRQRRRVEILDRSGPVEDEPSPNGFAVDINLTGIGSSHDVTAIVNSIRLAVAKVDEETDRTVGRIQRSEIHVPAAGEPTGVEEECSLHRGAVCIEAIRDSNNLASVVDGARLAV